MVGRPIRFKSEKDLKKLLNKKKTGVWTNKYLTRKVKTLEKELVAQRAWLSRIAARVLHDK